MNKVRLLILILATLATLVFLTYIVIESFKPKVAGIYIETVPTSSVWLNGRQVGQTPYRDSLKPGETVVRLIPEFTTATLKPYETKIRLAAGIETVVRYEFGPTDEASSGEVISFERNEIKQTSLVAVTIPDSTELVIDGVSRAFTPHKTSNIKAGEHILRFSAPGYKDRDVKVRTYANHKLTAIVKLAKVEGGTATITPSPSLEKANGEVEILDTGVGFLRVRNNPSSVGEEVGRVTPGKTYKILEVDEKSGWYKIEFEQINPIAGEPPLTGSGWVSNQFARKVGEEPTPTKTPTPTVNVASPSAATNFSPTPTKVN